MSTFLTALFGTLVGAGLIYRLRVWAIRRRFVHETQHCDNSLHRASAPHYATIDSVANVYESSIFAVMLFVGAVVVSLTNINAWQADLLILVPTIVASMFVRRWRHRRLKELDLR